MRRREAELSQATADLAAARDELVVLGLAEEAIDRLRTTRTIDSVLQVAASRDGTIVQGRVTVGQVIQAGETIAEIADLNYLWLVADVPEQDSCILKVG